MRLNISWIAVLLTARAKAIFKPLGGNIADAAIDVVPNPLDEMTGILVLHVEHLLNNSFVLIRPQRGDRDVSLQRTSPAEESRRGSAPAMQ